MIMNKLLVGQIKRRLLISMPLQGLWSVLHIYSSIFFVTVYLGLGCLQTLLLLLLLLLNWLAYLGILLLYATSLGTYHSALHVLLNLLFFRSWYRWIWPRFANILSRLNTLYFHHGIKLLSSLLELLFSCLIVWIWTNCWHRISSCFVSHHASNYSGLILNLNVNGIVRVDRASVWHWSLWASSTLYILVGRNSTHLSSRMQHLLILWHGNSRTTTSIHCIVHHATFV